MRIRLSVPRPMERGPAEQGDPPPVADDELERRAACDRRAAGAADRVASERLGGGRSGRACHESCSQCDRLPGRVLPAGGAERRHRARIRKLHPHDRALPGGAAVGLRDDELAASPTRQATSQARIAGATGLRRPELTAAQAAVKILKSEVFWTPQFATSATVLPSGENAAKRIPSPAFVPCILSVTSPCQTQSLVFGEFGLAVVYSPSSIWFASFGSTATTRIARPSGDHVGPVDAEARVLDARRPGAASRRQRRSRGHRRCRRSRSACGG